MKTSKNIFTRQGLSELFSDEMRRLVILALPIIGASLLQMTYSLADMIWVGNLGSDSVAAIGSAGFFLNFSWALATIITMGVNVKVSHAVGSKDKKAGEAFAASGFIGVIIIGIVYFSIIQLSATKLIDFYELRSVFVDTQATLYLRISVFGSLMTVLNLFFISLLNAHGLTKISFRASLIGTLINLLLDPILIFGFDLGVSGAAYATVFSTFVSTSFFVYLIFVKRVVPFGKIKMSWIHLKKIMQIGSPASLQRILFIVIYIFVARIIAEWGPEAIAVQKIGVQIEAITYMFVGGLSQAMAIAVGQRYGASDFIGIRKVFNAGARMAIFVGLFNSILFMAIPGLLFSIFLREPNSIDMGISYLRILAVSQMLMCLEMVVAGAYNGLGRTYVPATVSVVITIIRVPLAYVLGTYTVLGLDGVWWSISGTSILKGIIIYAFFRVSMKYLLEDPSIPQTGKDMACPVDKTSEEE